MDRRTGTSGTPMGSGSRSIGAAPISPALIALTPGCCGSLNYWVKSIGQNIALSNESSFMTINGRLGYLDV